MQAIVCTKFGPPEVLQLSEVEKPTPNDNEILVKIHATTVTSGDCRMRSFNVPPLFWLPGHLALGFRKPKKPILGATLAGEVAATGQAVTRYKAGDQVYGLTGHDFFGAYAEYVTVQEEGNIAPKPTNLSFEEAAAVPFGGITALNFLQAGSIQRGQHVLINGASGAVGVYAVQLAHHFGATVTGVCSTANLALVKSLGADHVIDYTQEDFTQNGQTYDIIFDTVGTTTFAQSHNSLKEKGVYLHAVMVAAEIKASWFALTTGKKVVGGTPTVHPDPLGFLTECLEAGAIKPIIDRRYPMTEIVEAHRYVDTGRKKGAVVITVVDGH